MTLLTLHWIASTRTTAYATYFRWFFKRERGQYYRVRIADALNKTDAPWELLDHAGVPSSDPVSHVTMRHTQHTLFMKAVP